MKISEYKQLFLNEAQEILNSANGALVNLEKDPADTASLNELFRHSHTLKSMAQSMEYEDITVLTHSMETALALLRSGELKADANTVALLFEALDALDDLVSGIRSGTKSNVKIGRLLEMFENIGSNETPDAAPNDIAGRPHASFEEMQAVRVPLSRLDSLMDITGELAISSIRLAGIAQAIGNESLSEAAAWISTLTSQLQGQAMQIRLVPLEYIFVPYSRMVRDMAADQEKEMDLVIRGSHIGMDRSIQAEINGSLLHLLKNAVTHGIESPEKRKKLKKAKRGRIELSARRERDWVIIELSDDGCGIDIENVRKTALERGLITREQLSELTPEEVMMLITYPGYSGVKKVTEAAGRGVGLNAVRMKVESFGGSLSMDSIPNQGTTFFIRLPLTVAMVQVMLVGIDDETCCIPLSHVTETMKIPADQIKTMEQHEIISHRDSVLPLLRLRQKLGFAKQTHTPDRIPIVVVEAGTKKVGLVVDSLMGQQEVTVKPLKGILNKLKGISGGTILSTGKIALIADIPSLI